MHDGAVAVPLPARMGHRAMVVGGEFSPAPAAGGSVRTAAESRGLDLQVLQVFGFIRIQTREWI